MKSIQHSLASSLQTFLVIGYFATSAAIHAIGPQGLPDGFQELAIGDAAPDFTLPGVDGKQYSLGDFADSGVLMILFTGTHCPTSHGIEKRLQSFVESMQDRDFQIIAINPNHSSGLRPDEFGHSLYDETFEDSKKYAEDLDWTFPFLYDGEEQTTARAYGCLATPHVFVFDSERKLRYQGRYDDSRFPDPSTVTSPDAVNAVHALLENKPVPVEKTRPHGCSTKWKERSQHVAEEEEQWQAAPVIIEEITAAEIAKLRANGTGKVRLFNVWATWCAPCVAEMPALTKIARKFSRREFELITITLDQPTQKEKAAAFLGRNRAVMSTKLEKSVKAEGRSTNNYLYKGASTDALVEALDSEWKGPIPYTVVIDGDGKVIHRVGHNFDPDKITKLVLDTLTPYHQEKKK